MDPANVFLSLVLPVYRSIQPKNNAMASLQHGTKGPRIEKSHTRHVKVVKGQIGVKPTLVQD
jgi:hypothetical protein